MALSSWGPSTQGYLLPIDVALVILPLLFIGDFMWFVFLGFTALSIPGIIIEMQDLDLLPNWIDGSYSLMYKWD